MEKIADNGMLELWMGERGGVYTMMHHELLQKDSRARLVEEFVRVWGGSQLVGNALAEMHEQPHAQAARVTVEQLVFVAAETVDTLYAECERRGWIVRVPSFGQEPSLEKRGNNG